MRVYNVKAGDWLLLGTSVRIKINRITPKEILCKLKIHYRASQNISIALHAKCEIVYDIFLVVKHINHAIATVNIQAADDIWIRQAHQ